MTPTNNGHSTTLLPPYAEPLASSEGRCREVAIAARRTEVDPIEVEALLNRARVDARVWWRPPFDPDKCPQDRDLVSRQAKVDGELAQLVKRKPLLDLDRREALQKAAAARAGIRRPHVPGLWFAALVAVFAMTVAPTLHDTIFFGLTDEMLNWFCSLLISALVGVAVVMGIFAAARLVPDEALRRGAVVSAVVLSAGLAVLRAAGARTLDEFALTFGLMLVEVGVIFLVEHVATRYQRGHSLADAQQREADRAGAVADTLQAEFARVEQREQALTAIRDRLAAAVAERAHTAIDVNNLEALFVKAAYNGYLSGIAENLARMNRLGGAA